MKGRRGESGVTSGTASFSRPSPRKRIPNPIIHSPKSFALGLGAKSTKAMPRPARGTAPEVMLNLNPKIEMIQAVIVVPTLAPRMIPADSVRVRSPAFTKLTTITVVAEGD